MCADEIVQKVARIWAPRFTANGVDPNDFAATTAAIETWERWLDGWTALADRYEERAVEAEGRGRLRSAGEFYRHASIALHFGEFVWFEDLERHNQAARRSAWLMRRSLALLDPSAERLEIPFDGAKLVANLRKPAGVQRPPVVILIPGLDSSKEEFCNFEEVFLARGMATAALDGPGQGETLQWLPMQPDYERPVAALIDELEKRDDLAPGAIGAMGMSLGGYFVVRAAAGEPRIRALVGLSGPLSVAGWLAAGISDISRNALRVKVGARRRGRPSAPHRAVRPRPGHRPRHPAGSFDDRPPGPRDLVGADRTAGQAGAQRRVRDLRRGDARPQQHAHGGQAHAGRLDGGAPGTVFLEAGRCVDARRQESPGNEEQGGGRECSIQWKSTW